MPPPREFADQTQAFVAALRSAWLSVFALVLAATYVGLGAMAHDFGFSVGWMTASTIIVWAAPAQVILLSTLAAGSPLVEVAIAVTLSAVRLFPMVVAMLPLLRRGARNMRSLILPTHFTSISMWVESTRLLPGIADQYRIAFCNGLSCGYMSVAVAFGVVGFYLAASLPRLLAAALLFITPMSFLVSTARNCRQLIDILAFIFGIILGPVLAWYEIKLDLMWSGVIGGIAAYGIHKLREAMT
jgi:predicted branched-subunit amino acid permease